MAAFRGVLIQQLEEQKHRPPLKLGKIRRRRKKAEARRRRCVQMSTDSGSSQFRFEKFKMFFFLGEKRIFTET